MLGKPPLAERARGSLVRERSVSWLGSRGHSVGGADLRVQTFDLDCYLSKKEMKIWEVIGSRSKLSSVD